MLNQIKIAVILLLALVGCTEKETQVEVSSVSLNTATIEMVEGETFSLVATVLPKDAEYDSVIWASSNASVASVNSGTVTAIKEGTATITASAGGKSATCTVKVSTKVVAVTSITLDKTSLSMKVGETETITATVNPENATDKTVTWGSSDVSVATVADGRVTAKKSGTAIITAKSGSCIAECTVTISVDVESVTLDKTTLSLAVGETTQLTATVKPDDTTDKNVAWASSDESVATVADGRVTAKKSGEATITAKSGSCIAECKVTITVSTETVTLDKTTLSLAIGETATLVATVKPDDATDKNVSWTSSDESIAKVDNGNVTAIKAGKANIVANCGGKTAECAVTVTVPTGSVTLDKTTLSLAVGETAQLTATVKPDDATDKNVMWTSSNESVAKVDNGKVTAVMSGNATITAKCGGKTAECVVTVSVPVSSITLDITSISLTVGETAQLTATVKPDNATDKTVVWTSSDESVAKVVNGKVTAHKSGTTSIAARCGSKSAECIVTVIVPVSSVTLDRNDLMLPVGDAATLIATVKPDNATSKNITWSSSNESVATVNNGNVIAAKEGEVIISASVGNVVAYCKVVVINANRVIKYTSESIVIPFNQDAFGAKIISNEYTYPNGLLIFDSPVTSIGKAAFYNCNNLNTMVLSENVTSIGDMAFMGCSKLSRINIPSMVLLVGKRAFQGCASLISIVLPEILSSLGDNAFSGCKKLETINLPKSILELGGSVFESCEKLSSTFVIPDQIRKIQAWTFYGCKNLTQVVLPETLETINDGAFGGTIKMKKLIIPENVKKLGSLVFSGSGIEQIVIPIGVERIEYKSFANCVNLSSISLPEGLTYIDGYAFENCENLKQIVLPSTLTNVGGNYGYCFSRCKNLFKVFVKAVTPPNIENAMGNFSDLVDIYVPNISLNEYKKKWWGYKDNIKGYDF